MTPSPTATIGALHFALVGATAAAFPPGESVSGFGAGDLEIDVRLEGEQPFLVIDHRLHPEAGETAHVEFWRCTGDHEAVRPHLLVVADGARPVQTARASSPTTLLALIESLPKG